MVERNTDIFKLQVLLGISRRSPLNVVSSRAWVSHSASQKRAYGVCVHFRRVQFGKVFFLKTNPEPQSLYNSSMMRGRESQQVHGSQDSNWISTCKSERDLLPWTTSLIRAEVLTSTQHSLASFYASHSFDALVHFPVIPMQSRLS